MTNSNKLTLAIFIAMVTGILSGAGYRYAYPDAAALQVFADNLSILTDIFLRLIKMIIAPLVVIAGTLALFNIPEAGLLLLLGVDHLLDMGRSATNVVGNAVATTVVSKWEGMLEV